MTAIYCLIFLARGQASSCPTHTTVTLCQELLCSCHENLGKPQGTSLPELEKWDNSWPDPTSNHCHYPYTPLYTPCCPAGWQLWVYLPSLGTGVGSQGWSGVYRHPLDGSNPVWSPALPPQGYEAAFTPSLGAGKESGSSRKTYKKECWMDSMYKTPISGSMWQIEIPTTSPWVLLAKTWGCCQHIFCSLFLPEEN